MANSTFKNLFIFQILLTANGKLKALSKGNSFSLNDVLTKKHFLLKNLFAN